MRSPSRITPALFALSLFVGCDGGDKEVSTAEPGTGQALVADAKEDAKDEVEDAKAPKDEDKGTAELTLGDDGEVWKAKRASARLKDGGKLRITASVQTTSEDKTSRRQLSLTVTDYKGPGKYVITDMMSNLTAVSLDLGGIKKAEAEGDKAKTDEEATKAALDGIKGGSVLLLRDAKVEITKADDDFIDGTIEWSGVSTGGPAKLSGTFHARVKD